jgi:hypothetical protein
VLLFQGVSTERHGNGKWVIFLRPTLSGIDYWRRMSSD